MHDVRNIISHIRFTSTSYSKSITTVSVANPHSVQMLFCVGTVAWSRIVPTYAPRKTDDTLTAEFIKNQNLS